jgi:DNA-cytosine methyltransferase
MTAREDAATMDADLGQLGQVLPLTGAAVTDLGPIWIVEETSGHLRSQNGLKNDCKLRLYRLSRNVLSVAGEIEVVPGADRAQLVIDLLEQSTAGRGVFVCSYRAAPIVPLLRKLSVDYRQLQYVFEVDHSRRLDFDRRRNGEKAVSVRSRLATASWKKVLLNKASVDTTCFAANLGKAVLGEAEDLTCFALSIGGIQDYRRGVLAGLTSIDSTNLKLLTQLLSWTRWIRLAVRKANRNEIVEAQEKQSEIADAKSAPAIGITIRANRKIAADYDNRKAQERAQLPDQPIHLRGALADGRQVLNVVELFAGAGGMGLGFLSAQAQNGRHYRISGSAEIHPTYVQTMRQNHAYMEAAGLTRQHTTPSEYQPMDLCQQRVRERLAAMVAEHGQLDVMIGGPPCQGFSTANRNSGSSVNPNNRLVDSFLECVTQMLPRVLVMENVQGILWTPRAGESSEVSVAAHVLERLQSMGYLVFPKLLDAVWYGAPQNRNRFFLMGIHQDLGYSPADFGEWGPFPKPTHGPGAGRPFVTVRDAIADLPTLVNGGGLAEQQYEASQDRMSANAFLRQMRLGTPDDTLWDHVTSRHAEYVIERYQGIPQGGNWESVRELMTNYADVERTHSNIYRRLAWDEPAITIGHYRKSMIIHPSQHRGLSLREASRLQTFPDWFRFAGNASGETGGLMHKQQQLANAVCPSVTKAVAEFILDL